MPPLKRKSRSQDLDSEAASFDRAFAAAIKASPPPMDAVAEPVRHLDASGSSPEERYNTIRARVKKKLADRFIDDEAGRQAYMSGSIHVVVGRYRVRGDLLDWDHELRSIHAKLDAKTRLKMITHVAKRLKVRV